MKQKCTINDTIIQINKYIKDWNLFLFLFHSSNKTLQKNVISRLLH